jgi:hypothetical protein
MPLLDNPETASGLKSPPNAEPPLCLAPCFLNVFAASPKTFLGSIPGCAFLNAATCLIHAVAIGWINMKYERLCLKERKYILNPFKNGTALFYNFIQWSRTTEETRAKGWRAST